MHLPDMVAISVFSEFDLFSFVNARAQMKGKTYKVREIEIIVAPVEKR